MNRQRYSLAMALVESYLEALNFNGSNFTELHDYFTNYLITQRSRRRIMKQLAIIADAVDAIYDNCPSDYLIPAGPIVPRPLSTQPELLQFGGGERPLRVNPSIGEVERPASDQQTNYILRPANESPSPYVEPVQPVQRARPMSELVSEAVRSFTPAPEIQPPADNENEPAEQPTEATVPLDLTPRWNTVSDGIAMLNIAGREIQATFESNEPAVTPGTFGANPLAVFAVPPTYMGGPRAGFLDD